MIGYSMERYLARINFLPSFHMILTKVKMQGKSLRTPQENYKL
jgi:hypothetical protein